MDFTLNNKNATAEACYVRTFCPKKRLLAWPSGAPNNGSDRSCNTSLFIYLHMLGAALKTHHTHAHTDLQAYGFSLLKSRKRN